MSELVRLGDHVLKIGSGQTPSGGHASYLQTGVPLIRSQNVLMGCFSSQGLAYISEEQDMAMSGSRVFPGDVLLNITGASVGRVCVAPAAHLPANVNQHVCIIRCKDTLRPEYLAYVLASARLQNFIWDSQAGATRQALTKQMIEEFRIPWVEDDRQRQIVRDLSSQLAAAADARQAVQAQLKDVALLANKLRDQAMMDLSAFQRVPVEKVLQGIEAGKSFQTSERLASDKELGVLKVSAVSWGEFKPREAKAVEGDYVPDDRHRIRKGDVIVSRANTIALVGAVVRAERDYPQRLLSDKTLRLILDTTQCDPDYFVEALRLPEARSHIEANATGSSDSMRNIAQGALAATPIPLPDIDEQRRLAKHMQGVSRELAALRASIQARMDEIEQLPARLLAQVFDTL